MGRRPCCEKEGLNRGVWTAMEDKLLKDYIQLHGQGQWRSLPIKAGLKRCGKSCRLRWLNYLNPSIKRGNITPDEEDLIIRLHKLLGNRWALIAGRLPGRTDNEIKNYWNTNLSKRVEHDNNPKRQSKCYTKKITKPAEKVQSKSSPNTVIRTKAVKCTKAVLAPPPPPPPLITTEPPLVPPPLMDLATMDDFNMSFSEFFDSQKLTSSLMSSDVCSPTGFVDDIFSEEMMEDWKANDFALDASMLESLLQV